jgi:membrane fusion protein (multidrug efflux system)
LRNVSVGAYVSNTDILASIQQFDSLKIDFTVPDEYSALIKKGNTVSITPNGVGQSKQKAIILATEPQVNTQTRNLRVRALMPNSAANIGSFAKVNLEAGENKNAILVPTSSIIPDDKSNKVVVIRGGKTIYTDVMTGIRETNNIEITSGLKEGDSVAVTGILFTRNKGAVKVRSVKMLADLNK